MGATQSSDVPIVELKHNLSDDGALAGFATKDEALEDATAAMAMLSPLGLIAAAARDMTAPAESTTTESTTQDGGAIHLSDYRLEKKVLGEGAFGKVRRCSLKSNGTVPRQLQTAEVDAFEVPCPRVQDVPEPGES